MATLCDKCGTPYDYLCSYCFSDKPKKKPVPYEETIFYRRCKKKNAYSTNWIAIQVARKATEDTKELIEPYKCPYGQHWHVGHAALRPRKTSEPKTN